MIAVEPEPALRAYAQEAALAAAVAVRVLPGRAESLPLEDGSVDVVVASLVLCTVPDQSRALAEAGRVLRDGGELRFYEQVIAGEQPLRAIVRFRRSLAPVACAGRRVPSRSRHRRGDRAGGL